MKKNFKELFYAAAALASVPLAILATDAADFVPAANVYSPASLRACTNKLMAEPQEVTDRVYGTTWVASAGRIHCSLKMKVCQWTLPNDRRPHMRVTEYDPANPENDLPKFDIMVSFENAAKQVIMLGEKPDGENASLTIFGRGGFDFDGQGKLEEILPHVTSTEALYAQEIANSGRQLCMELTGHQTDLPASSPVPR